MSEVKIKIVEDLPGVGTAIDEKLKDACWILRKLWERKLLEHFQMQMEWGRCRGLN